jgi:hypothetical protein
MMKPFVRAAALLVMGLAAQIAGAASPAGTHPHTLSRSRPGIHTSKASSFAPRASHSGRHVYGAPIQKPILGRRTKHPTGRSQARHSPTPAATSATVASPTPASPAAGADSKPLDPGSP